MAQQKSIIVLLTLVALQLAHGESFEAIAVGVAGPAVTVIRGSAMAVATGLGARAEARSVTGSMSKATATASTGGQAVATSTVSGDGGSAGRTASSTATASAGALARSVAVTSPGALKAVDTATASQPRNAIANSHGLTTSTSTSTAT